MATFVLVHGGWDGGWAWKQVEPHLRAAGHEVLRPTLTGSGERMHLATPEIGLDTHVTDVVNVLRYEELADAVLVGWSYGGMVITGVAERVPERLRHLVYLDAFVPRDGDSLLGLLGPEGAGVLEQQARELGDGWRIPLPFPGATDRNTDVVLKTATQPLRVENPAAARLARTYILCTEKPDSPLFRHFTAAAARAQAEGWRYRELPTGHTAVWTMPSETAALLVEAAAHES
jgi:pimeloyl-ACP methyl ester carboxylesterase